MSLGYAEKLSYRKDVGTVGMSEIFDPPDLLHQKGKVKFIPGVSKKKDEEDQGHTRDCPQVEISNADLDCLAPKSFLTSNVMNFYIWYLGNRASSMGAGRLDCHYFSTFFYTKLLQEVQKKNVRENRVTQLRRWWKGINIFEKTYIFVPIHEHSHWSLVIICMPDKEDKSGVILLHLDSLKLHSSNSLFRNIKSFLIEEWKFLRQKDPQPTLLIADEIHQRIIEVPQQENDYDCGLFVLYFIERFLEDTSARQKKTDLERFGKEWFKPEEASSLRQKIKNLMEELENV